MAAHVDWFPVPPTTHHLLTQRGFVLDRAETTASQAGYSRLGVPDESEALDPIYALAVVDPTGVRVAARHGQFARLAAGAFDARFTVRGPQLEGMVLGHADPDGMREFLAALDHAVRRAWALAAMRKG